MKPHLKLVYSNKKLVENNSIQLKGEKTCKTHCALYHDDLNSCIVFPNVNYNDPAIPKRCLEFADSKKLEKLYRE